MIREPLIGSYARYPNIPKYHVFALGHVAYRLPLRDVGSHVGVKQLLNWTLYPFGGLSWQEKRVLLFNKHLFKFHQYE